MVSWWPGKLRLNLQVLFRLVSYSQTYGIKLNSTPPAVPLKNDLHGALLYFFFSFLFFSLPGSYSECVPRSGISRFWFGIKRSSGEITALIVEEGNRGGSRRLCCVFFLFFFFLCANVVLKLLQGFSPAHLFPRLQPDSMPALAGFSPFRGGVTQSRAFSL